MKHLLAFLLLSLSCCASDVTLAWNPVTGCTYRLYWGPSSNALTVGFSTPATNATVRLLKGSNCVFAVTALWTSNSVESDLSPLVPWPVPGPLYSAPLLARLQTNTFYALFARTPLNRYGVQRSNNGTNSWSTFTNQTATSTGQLPVSVRKTSGVNSVWFRTFYPPQ